MATKTSAYTKDEAYAMQKLAREQMKMKLLQDILIDLQICQLEGWNHKEYIEDLQGMLSKVTLE